MRTSHPMPLDLMWWAKALQAVAGLLVAGFVGAAMVGPVRRADVGRARALVADGVLSALALMLPAAVFCALWVRTWDEIGAFAVVLGMRILVKRLFLWERSRPSGAR